MIKAHIEALKTEGMVSHLRDAASTRLWNAGRALEDAKKDRFKEFRKKIKEARRLIDEAETLYNETESL